MSRSARNRTPGRWRKSLPSQVDLAGRNVALGKDTRGASSRWSASRRCAEQATERTRFYIVRSCSVSLANSFPCTTGMLVPKKNITTLFLFLRGVQISDPCPHDHLCLQVQL
jgi:hypothetical protein